MKTIDVTKKPLSPELLGKMEAYWIRNWKWTGAK